MKVEGRIRRYVASALAAAGLALLTLFADLYFFVAFGTDDPELLDRLVAEIGIDRGEIVYTRDGAEPANRFKGVVENIDGPLTMRIGDLPPIRIIPGLPLLTYAVQAPEDSLLLFGGEHGTHLLVPADTEEVVLAFSEPLRSGEITAYTSDYSAQVRTGEWLDDRRVAVSLLAIGADRAASPSQDDVLYVQMQHVIAESGAYLHGDFASPLFIRKIPQRAWLRYPQAEPVEAGPFGGFYDGLLFPPNRERGSV
jgi:hypothetical protein